MYCYISRSVYLTFAFFLGYGRPSSFDLVITLAATLPSPPSPMAPVASPTADTDMTTADENVERARSWRQRKVQTCPLACIPPILNGSEPTCHPILQHGDRLRNQPFSLLGSRHTSGHVVLIKAIGVWIILMNASQLNLITLNNTQTTKEHSLSNVHVWKCSLKATKIFVM